MDSYALDKLVMLLSADWFLPHWREIGVFAGENKKGPLKEGCREIVRQIMGGAKQYWDIDFGQERVRKTRSMFDTLIDKCKLEKTAVDRIGRLASAGEPPLDEGTRWLLLSLTEQLLDNSVTAVPALDIGIKEALHSHSQQWHNPAQTDFKYFCLASTTVWDKYLRDITPDLPAMLADYVSGVASQSKFEVLWGFINAELTRQQRHDLFNWYRSVGQSLTGEPLHIAYEA